MSLEHLWGVSGTSWGILECLLASLCKLRGSLWYLGESLCVSMKTWASSGRLRSITWDVSTRPLGFLWASLRMALGVTWSVTHLLNFNIFSGI